jgi:hypothetical protein
MRYLDVIGADGNRLSLRIVGYQFPDASDPALLFSWHMVNGTVSSADGAWSFDGPALTCHESPAVSRWLRDVASSIHDSTVLPELAFIEPNLTFEATRAADGAVLVVGFDLEFQPPWRPGHGAGDPYRVDFRVDGEQLITAADQWDADIARFPDGLAS